MSRELDNIVEGTRLISIRASRFYGVTRIIKELSNLSVLNPKDTVYATQNLQIAHPGLIDMDGTERTHSTLRIGNVTEADQGKIWCVAEYESGMHDSDKAELTVVGKFVIWIRFF